MEGSLACAAAIVARTRQYSGAAVVLSDATRSASVTTAPPVGKANALADTFIAPRPAHRRVASSTSMSASAAFAGWPPQLSIAAQASTKKTIVRLVAWGLTRCISSFLSIPYVEAWRARRAGCEAIKVPSRSR